MEDDKLILSLLARVRTWTEEGIKMKFCGAVALFSNTQSQKQNI